MEMRKNSLIVHLCVYHVTRGTVPAEHSIIISCITEEPNNRRQRNSVAILLLQPWYCFDAQLEAAKQY